MCLFPFFGPLLLIGYIDRDQAGVDASCFCWGSSKFHSKRARNYYLLGILNLVLVIAIVVLVLIFVLTNIDYPEPWVLLLALTVAPLSSAPALHYARWAAKEDAKAREEMKEWEKKNPRPSRNYWEEIQKRYKTEAEEEVERKEINIAPFNPFENSSENSTE